MKLLLKTLLFLIIVAGAAYGGLRYGQEHPAWKAPVAAPSPTPDTSTAGLTSYTEPTSHFTIKYPVELKLSTTAPNYPAPTTNPRGQVFSFSDSYSEGTNLVDASITATKEDGGQTACNKPVPSANQEVTPTNVTLGGRQWLLSTGEDHGAGQIYAYRAYSSAQDTICYRIFLSTHSTSVPPKSTQPAFDEAHFEQVLDQIVASFKLS